MNERPASYYFTILIMVVMVIGLCAVAYAGDKAKETGESIGLQIAQVVR